MDAATSFSAPDLCRRNSAADPTSEVEVADADVEVVPDESSPRASPAEDASFLSSTFFLSDSASALADVAANHPEGGRVHVAVSDGVKACLDAEAGGCARVSRAQHAALAAVRARRAAA